MSTGADVAEHVRPAAGDQGSGRAVVHGHDHCGRAAGGADTAHHVGSSAQLWPTAAVLLRDGECEQTGFGQGFDLSAGEAAGPVDLVRRGSEHVVDDLSYGR